jgi:hypothetical protein
VLFQDHEVLSKHDFCAYVNCVLLALCLTRPRLTTARMQMFTV